MTRKLAILCILLVVLAAPATPFWGAFFSGIGKAVGKAIGIPQMGGGLSGLMPVTIKAAQPVIEAANERLGELQNIRGMASGTLEHFSGAVGTLRDVQNLTDFRATATRWLRSATANRFGTSGRWADAINGDTPSSNVVDAYGNASVPVPDWTGAMLSLDAELQAGVRREHASLEIADAAAVRSLAVLGEARRLAAERRTAHDNLERAVLDSSNGSQSMPALLGKLTVGQVRQLSGVEQTNQLLDALLEAELATSKRERDQLARSMDAAADYSELVAAQPVPQWRMP
ncbi:MAG: hypothetical protein OXN96_03095 [Bryobacterales bacterium]|nr:hypothetical protein [Bryobacterales bacterium]